MKAEHISIALNLEDIPNVGRGTAKLLRECGLSRPEQLAGEDPVALYDKICQITRRTHPVKLLDILISAVHFAKGDSPRHWSEYQSKRVQLLATPRPSSRKTVR